MPIDTMSVNSACSLRWRTPPFYLCIRGMLWVSTCSSEA